MDSPTNPTRHALSTVPNDYARAFTGTSTRQPWNAKKGTGIATITAQHPRYSTVSSLVPGPCKQQAPATNPHENHRKNTVKDKKKRQNGDGRGDRVKLKGGFTDSHKFTAIHRCSRGRPPAGDLRHEHPNNRTVSRPYGAGSLKAPIMTRTPILGRPCS